jgi:hypothetical protein
VVDVFSLRLGIQARLATLIRSRRDLEEPTSLKSLRIDAESLGYRDVWS